MFNKVQFVIYFPAIIPKYVKPTFLALQPSLAERTQTPRRVLTALALAANSLEATIQRAGFAVRKSDWLHLANNLPLFENWPPQLTSPR